MQLGSRAHQPEQALVHRGPATAGAGGRVLRLLQLHPQARELLLEIVHFLGGALVARFPVPLELAPGGGHAHLGLQPLHPGLELIPLVDDVVVGAADPGQLLLGRIARVGRRLRLGGAGVAVRLEHRELLLVLVPIPRPAQELRELALHLQPRVQRVRHLRFGLLELLAQVARGRLFGVELAADHAGCVARLRHLPLELAKPILHRLRRPVLLLDRGRGLLRPSQLGDDLARLGQLLHQLAALLAQLRELGVLLLELVGQLLFLAGGRIELLSRGAQLLLRPGRLLLAGLDLLLQLVLPLGEHLDQVVLLLQLPADGIALRAADGDAVLELLDLALQRLGIPAALGLDGRFHPLPLALQLRRRVVRLLLVQLLLQLFQLFLALLEQRADLLRVRPGRRRRVVRGLLLPLLDLHLEPAVLLLEEGDPSPQGGDLQLVLRLHLRAERRSVVPARLVGDDSLGRRHRGHRRRPRGIARRWWRRYRPLLGPVRARARLRLLAHKRRLGHAEGDHVAVVELLAVDVPVVDEGAVGGPQVHEEILPVLAPDLRVLGGDAGVGDPDVARRSTPDGHRVGAQLDLLAFQGSVENAQQRHGSRFLLGRSASNR